MKVFLVRFYIVLVFAGGWMAQLFSLLPKLALLLLCLMSPVLLHAETMAGTVLDPSGAVIVGARIEIAGTQGERNSCRTQNIRSLTECRA